MLRRPRGHTTRFPLGFSYAAELGFPRDSNSRDFEATQNSDEVEYILLDDCELLRGHIHIAYKVNFAKNISF